MKPTIEDCLELERKFRIGFENEPSALHAYTLAVLDQFGAKAEAQAVPDHRIADKGFRWDAERLQHVPQVLIEFDPVPANSPNDAKGWRDRDALVSMLAAATVKESLTAAQGGAEPFMWGISDPDGNAHFDELCVGSDADSDLADTVRYLNEGREEEDGFYKVVPLYAAPQPDRVAELDERTQLCVEALAHVSLEELRSRTHMNLLQRAVGAEVECERLRNLLERWATYGRGEHLARHLVTDTDSALAEPDAKGGAA